MTFWEKVRAYANKKVKREYMDKYHHDRKCPNCKLWISEVGGVTELEYLEFKYEERMTCKQCGYTSRWDCRGMVPVLFDFQFTHVPTIKEVKLNSS